MIDPEFRALIPPLAPEELAQLEANILRDGCRDPLVVWRWRDADQERDIAEACVLIDGHNRYDICEKNGLEYDVQEMDFDSATDAKVWMIDNQRGRRNLTDGWRYELSQTRKAMLLEKGKQNMSAGGGDKITGLSIVDKPAIEKTNTRDEIATELGWSTGKVAMADVVWKKAEPEVKEQIKAGEISIAAAYKEVQQAERRDHKQQVILELKNREVLPASGSYDVIVIDPPWPMEKIERDVRPNQVAFDYPVMSEDEIKAVELPASDDCHVWVWTTHKFLPMALRCVEAWGLKYVCTFVWHKPGGFQPIGLPQYNCEFALYCRKGSPLFADTKAFNTAFTAPRGQHSEKPEEFYDVVRRVTAGKRIDMFNRREIDGFDTWGNESAAMAG
jgi:N6-adenosine-specific RNA methylase IME4